MLRTLQRKLRSSTPWRRHKWLIRNFPSIQYPQIVQTLKFPQSIQQVEIKTKSVTVAIVWLSFAGFLSSRCAGFMTSAIQSSSSPTQIHIFSTACFLRTIIFFHIWMISSWKSFITYFFEKNPYLKAIILNHFNLISLREKQYPDTLSIHLPE